MLNVLENCFCYLVFNYCFTNILVFNLDKVIPDNNIQVNSSFLYKLVYKPFNINLSEANK